ncbi:hypothetical protein [Laspinema olomoucense]|uniref:hypothetical protein n=1 Tax=Laspinema olomoucense TaxID=3231600 RepID=UPI0021BB19B2|nr:hypothetical protein [Laspinema sp. D3c]MCT7994427.1 hypothetical protein [Laspinema sp. D3c]
MKEQVHEMIIIKKTPTQLQLRHRPYFVWLISGGLVLGLPFLLLAVGSFLTWIVHLWWIPLLLLLTLGMGNFTLVCWGPVVTCTLDKQCDRLILKYDRAIASKRIEYSLAEIREVLIESRTWEGDIPQNFQIVLFLKNGGFIPLEGVSSSWKTHQETANIIRAFLGLPQHNLFKG